MTSTAPAETAGTVPRPEARRRVLRVLVASQVLSGAGLAAGITVGALLAQDMLGSTDLAGLPSALFTAGSALAAVAVGRMSQARGRRPGLAAGYLTGAVGSAGVIAAAVADTPVLLFVALFVYGAGTATNLQARYAGADLAAPRPPRPRRLHRPGHHHPRRRRRSQPRRSHRGPRGNPPHTRLAGPFLLAGAAYALAALVLVVWLRPDPLLLARGLDHRQQAAAAAAEGAGDAAPGPDPERGPGPIPGALTMILTQLVMVAVMTMTPVHMQDHGHGTAASGLVIAIHVGAMYLPSPLTGWLVDSCGRTAVAASGLTLLAAGIVAAVAPGDSVALLALALALLGLGWNFGLVSGTVMITDAVPLATRAKPQGMVDVSVAVAVATGGLTSGLVVSAAGCPVLALAGGVLSPAVLPAIAATASGR
ncbi:MFS family permease [Streptomyces griseostramineus]|uniref:MFS family permease n=1 Tax=Streptomyces griseomycini TaxID=66895 RepID=A0A7W7PU78_9ACTN|nr:MFS family permease [Streptomyces griseomycini]